MTEKSFKARWFEKSFLEQVMNVGTEIDRAIRLRGVDDNVFIKKVRENPDIIMEEVEKYPKGNVQFALTCLHLTIIDPKNAEKVKELSKQEKNFINYFDKHIHRSRKQIMKYWDSYVDLYVNRE